MRKGVSTLLLLNLYEALLQLAQLLRHLGKSLKYGKRAVILNTSKCGCTEANLAIGDILIETTL
jgi:hypothetical protein